MADEERTEQPTPRRRMEARSRGQVPRSQDFTAAVLTLVGLIALDMMGRYIFERMFAITHTLLGGSGELLMHGSQLLALGREVALEMIAIVTPLLIIFFFTALVIAMLQTGLLLTAEPLKPDLNKINPIAGLKRIFSTHSLVTLLIGMGKMIAVGAVVYLSIAGQLDTILFSSGVAVGELVLLAGEVFITLGLRVAALLIVLGIIDWFFQKYRHEQSLKMSKQEIKDEMRRMDGDPLMKRRRREVQMQLAAKRLKSTVPEADVVVTNPTHVAVALRYEPGEMAAPKVIAKGEDYMAQRIREIAIEAGIPIVQKKELARALHKLVKVGQEIPPHLYKAVAEVLAYVYELSGRRQHMRSVAQAPV